MSYKDKERGKENAKKWVKENPEKVKANQKKYVEANKDTVRANSLAWYHRNKERDLIKSRAKYHDGRRIKDWLIKQYGDQPCMDCDKVWLFCAMDFDHRPDEVKSFCVSKLNVWVATPSSIAKVMKEIDKCDFVCASCHRVRTWKRNNS